MTDWREIVGAVAPTLAKALGGPLAGVAVAALSDKLLGRPDGAAEDVGAAILAGGPDALLAIKQADQSFAVRMRELDIDLERLHQTDRGSARAANVAGGIQGRVFALVLLIFVSVLSVEAAVLFVGVPPDVDGQVIGRILGTLDAVLMAALFYVFGSSAGSAQKTALLGKA
jgi:hypothetical protein